VQYSKADIAKPFKFKMKENFYLHQKTFHTL